MQQNAALVVQLQRQAYQTVAPMSPTQTLNIQRSPFPKWYGTPPSKIMFLEQVDNYRSETYYPSVSYWICTTLSTRHISVSISANMLPSLPRAQSSMFLNDAHFVYDGISVLSHLLYHLNPSSSDNLLLAINNLNHLEMSLNKTSIYYMSCV